MLGWPMPGRSDAGAKLHEQRWNYRWCCEHNLSQADADTHNLRFPRPNELANRRPGAGPKARIRDVRVERRVRRLHLDPEA